MDWCENNLDNNWDKKDEDKKWSCRIGMDKKKEEREDEKKIK